MKYKSIKGTKDILPDESHIWIEVENRIRKVMHTYNYKEIRTPIFEETKLFARGIGEFTDIVGKEMYTFTDRGGDSLTLKPEVTASVIRAYIQHNLGEKQPLTKVYYISPAFRQERPQAGRLRQFHQFGAEAIGSKNPAVDAEIISLAANIYESFGIRDFVIKINSVGCEICRNEYKNILKKFLIDISNKLSPESQKRIDVNPMRVLDSKDENDRIATKSAPLILNYLCNDCKTHFAQLQDLLSFMNVTFEVDGRIVRGLDYYTKTAFEIISTELGSQDALAGGGRYDLLVKELGGKDTPAVGFAAGLERLLMVLQKQNQDKFQAPRPKVFIAYADKSCEKIILNLAQKLRAKGVPCEIDLLNRSLKSQMREADRQNSDFVIVVGENEVKSNRLNIKNMKTGKVEEIDLGNLENYFLSSNG
ncbi:MAG: Histidyl-tRNA synthetase [Ignavibacteriae bacterium]|nr:MAG: Histidyl-tRNA synthetase [Ignavibacteriota bacterium]